METISPNSSLENSSIAEFIQDLCVVCSSKCFVQKVSPCQQISSDELLSLLDTPSDGTKTHLPLCSTCLRAVFQLEGIHQSLQNIQSKFKEVQEEMASKILSCRTEEVVSEAAYNVKDSIYKRWGPVLNRHSQNSEESCSRANGIASIIGLSSKIPKIPKGLIISPASPTADVYQQEIDSSNEDINEVRDSDENSNHPNPGIQFHLDPSFLKTEGSSGPWFDVHEFDDTNSKMGSLDTNSVEYVEVPESDDEDQEMDEEEVNAEDLIPSIEITSFSNESEYLRVNGVAWNEEANLGEDPSSTTDMAFPISSSSSSNHNINNNNVKQESAVHHSRYGHVSSANPGLYYPSNSSLTSNKLSTTTRFHDEPSANVPVGLPALSPNFQSRLGKKQRPAKKKKLSKNPNSKASPIFNCTVCPQSFRNREQFKDHLDYHKGEAPTCSICKKVFPRKHNLIIHLRTHTGEKPYECPVCERQYSDRSNFNAHVRKHVSKPFGCILCGRMFVDSASAHVHATAIHADHAIDKIISKVTFKKNKSS